MAVIRLERDEMGSYSAFTYAKKVLEAAKDIASPDQKIEINLERFSENEAAAITRLLLYAQMENPHSGTLYSLRTRSGERDQVSSHMAPIGKEPAIWEQSKQQMRITFHAASLPAYRMQSSLANLNRFLFTNKESDHVFASPGSNGQRMLIECNTQASAEFLGKYVVMPLMEAHNMAPSLDRHDLSVTPIKDSQEAYLEVNKELYDFLRQREIGGRGISL